MNYYRRYMADYLSKTASLSMLEHGAYTLLLDYSYLSENGALPGDENDIFRLVRAVKQEEKKAIRKILAMFFHLSNNGFENDRVTKEIRKARPAIEAARANGLLGGRPRGNPEDNPPDNPLGSKQEPSAKASQPPTTNRLTPNRQPVLKPIVGQDPPDAVDKSKKDAPRVIAIRTIGYLNECAGTNFKAGEKGGAANEKFIIDRITSDGASEEELRAVVDLKIKHWQKGEFDRKYLRPETLFNKTKFAGYVGQINLHAPAAAVAKVARMAKVAVWKDDMPRPTYLADTPAPAAMTAEQIAKRVKQDFAQWLSTRSMKYIRIEIPGEADAQFSLAEL